MSKPESILKELLNSDSFDELIVWRLDQSLDVAIEYLEQWSREGKVSLIVWNDFVDTLAYAKALVKVLEWLTINDSSEILSQLNQYSVILDNEE